VYELIQKVSVAGPWINAEQREHAVEAVADCVNCTWPGMGGQIDSDSRAMAAATYSATSSQALLSFGKLPYSAAAEPRDHSAASAPPFSSADPRSPASSRGPNSGTSPLSPSRVVEVRPGIPDKSAVRAAACSMN